MNQSTVDKLKQNPHYKFPANGKEPEPEEDEDVKTYGVLPKQNTITIPKHPTKPKTKTNKLIEKAVG